MQKSSNIAYKIALSGNALLLIFIFTLIFSVIPPRLFDASWLANFSTELLDNSGFAIVGVLSVALAHYIDPDNESLSSHFRKLTFICIGAALGFLLLIPLQFYISYQFVATIRQQNLIQFQQSARQVDFFAEKIKQAANFDELQAVMKTYQSIQLPESERLKPLNTTKQFFLSKIKEAKILLNNSRRPDILRKRSWDQYKISIRNSLLSFSYFLAFAGLAQRRQSEQSWLQEIMQAFLNLLNSGLHRRELKVSYELQAQETQENIQHGPLDLASLHQHGVIDEAWLPDSSANDHGADPRPEDFSQSLGERPRPPGPFAWFRSPERRQDDPTAFLETLANKDNQLETDPNDAEVGTASPPSPIQQGLSADAFPSTQRRPLSSSPNRNKLIDLDYFEQLAEEVDEHQGDQSSPKQ